MIFEKELLSLGILDVLKLSQNEVDMFNTGRNFDALSFRVSSDACIEAGGNVYRTGDHSVCFVPARLDYRRVAGHDELIVIHFSTANYVGKSIECFTPHEPQRLRALFEQILACWNAKEAGYRYRASALLYEIFAECHVQFPQPVEAGSKIQKSLEYIAENYKKHDLSISEIAGQSFMSEVYFRKLFKERFGISPQKYIIQLRIQHAVSLMSTGYYSLQEIADLSGYNDYKYFSVEFKRQKGVSPSEYLYNYRE